MTHRARAGVCLALLLSGCWPAPARGDGGTLRAWKRQAGYDIAVFTDPTPVVTGRVDISVLLLDPATGEPIQGADVTVEVAPPGRPARALRQAATSEAATNKLLRAALFDLEIPGPQVVLVTIAKPKGPARVEFGLDVARSRAASLGDWPWILWPVPVIAVYAIHRRLVQKRSGIEVGVRPSAGLDHARTG